MKEWQSVTKDPNAPQITRARQGTLAGARNSELVKDRIDYLCQLVKGKRVLDVGVVDHQLGSAESPEWLHGRLCGVASECEGVDVLPEEVAELRRRGFSVSCTNIVERPLPREFDVVVCGEVLEHIDATRGFLENCRKMLAQNGQLILTVPNPWYANVIMKAAFGNLPFQDNADHVAWYDPSTIYELGGRCGFELHKYSGVRVQAGKSFAARCFFKLADLWIKLGLRQEVLAKTMIYEFRLGTTE
jgi:SAM-dependent methyltransferase